MRVLWARAARNDRRRITAWLAERNLPAAVRIAQALSDAADGLAAVPYKGRPGRAPDTCELSAVPPYVMVYEVDDDAQVIQILRLARGPGPASQRTMQVPAPFCAPPAGPEYCSPPSPGALRPATPPPRLPRCFRPTAPAFP